MRCDNKVQVVKDRLTMKDVLSRYGYNVNPKGFMCCPFHHERTPSFKAYEGDFHCFGCGEHGDVLTFVQRVFGLSLPETLKKLDVDFGLNLYGDISVDDYRKSKYQQMALEAKKKREKAEKNRADVEYWEIFDEWKRLDDNKRAYAPKSPDEELHPLYVEAVQKIAHQQYLLGCAEERRCQLERANNSTDADNGFVAR